MVQATYNLSYRKYRTDCEFLTNGVADSGNSYSDYTNVLGHTIRLNQTINLSSLQLMPNISANWGREDMDYHRGRLDTTAVRHNLFINPSLRATLKLNKTIGFEMNYNFRTQRPQILHTLDYRDLTNPLFITEGNPNLKDLHIHNISLNYNMVLARTQTNISAAISHQYMDRDEVNALSYDPTTAVYVSRPENVKGRKTWEFKLIVDQALGDYFRLQNNFRLRDERRYAYLTLLPTQPERILTRQTAFNPKDKLTISFDKDWLKTSVYASIDADRFRLSASPEQNTTHWDNEFGIDAEVTWGNFVFETDITEQTRRGYASQTMNRNLLLWNGGVTWKILKNKARVKFEFQDILNNEDGFYCEESAYQRTTSWRDFRHHYLGISFTYHLDAKKKD